MLNEKLPQIPEEFGPDFFLSTFAIRYYSPNSSRFRFRDEPFEKSIAIDSLPRERLVQMGANSLSNIELLAILLGHGTKDCPVLQLATQLIARFGSLAALADASVQELSAFKGIGLAKAAQLKAAFALHSRIFSQPIDKICFDRPGKIFDLVASELKHEQVEVLMVILLDARKRYIHREIVAKGILNEILVHPREVFHVAIRHRAHSIVIAHNHPSGDATPSEQDLKMTQILQKSGQILGIQLADHLIIAGDEYLSFSERNLLNGETPN